MSNSITIKPDGPLVARGKIRVLSSTNEVLAEGEEVFLCRCGASQNKPFCDGSHKNIPFSDDAMFTDDKSEPLQNDAELVISLRDNAMLIAKGPMTISNKAGTCHSTRNKAALCRCGASSKKPFCDASHKSL